MRSFSFQGLLLRLIAEKYYFRITEFYNIKPVIQSLKIVKARRSGREEILKGNGRRRNLKQKQGLRVVLFNYIGKGLIRMSLKNSIKEFKAYFGDKDSVLDTHYQRIAQGIQLQWGYPEIYSYLNKLLLVEKDRNRNGFPLEVLQEIHVLQQIHEKLFPVTKGATVNNPSDLPSKSKNKGITWT